ncbi:MAG TPA: hypothetical protein VJM32_02760 [Candidatus Saccharimonadales bacterium]|nr:hypothetical protein [Candidatus Saccharimonadales bacterium]
MATQRTQDRCVAALLWGQIALVVMILVSQVLGAALGFRTAPFTTGLVTAGVLAGLACQPLLRMLGAANDPYYAGSASVADLVFLLGVAAGFLFLPVQWAWVPLLVYSVLVCCGLFLLMRNWGLWSINTGLIMVGIGVLVVLVLTPVYAVSSLGILGSWWSYGLACIVMLGYGVFVAHRFLKSIE